MQYPVTPDGRYFVVRGRLWRCSDPRLSDDERGRLVGALMVARRALRGADDRAGAREAVDRAKRGLGERGPVWWTDGAPDFNRKLAKNTPYAAWFDSLDRPVDTDTKDAGTSRDRRAGADPSS